MLNSKLRCKTLFIVALSAFGLTAQVNAQSCRAGDPIIRNDAATVIGSGFIDLFANDEAGYGRPYDVSVFPQANTLENNCLGAWHYEGLGLVYYYIEPGFVDTCEVEYEVTAPGDFVQTVQLTVQADGSNNPVLVPIILANTVNLTVTEGDDATFRFETSGADRYDWYRTPDELLQSGPSDTLVLPNVTLAMDGTSYFADACNQHGCTRSDTATLNVEADSGREAVPDFFVNPPIPWDPDQHYTIHMNSLKANDTWTTQWYWGGHRNKSSNINQITVHGQSTVTLRVGSDFQGGTLTFEYRFRDGPPSDNLFSNWALVTFQVAEPPTGDAIAYPDDITFDVWKRNGNYVIRDNGGGVVTGVLDNDLPPGVTSVFTPDNWNPSAGTLNRIVGSPIEGWVYDPPAFHDGSPITFNYRAEYNGTVSNPTQVTLTIPRHPIWPHPDTHNAVSGTQILVRSSTLRSNDEWDNPPIDGTPSIEIDGGTATVTRYGADWLVQPNGSSNQYFDYHLEYDGIDSRPTRVALTVLPSSHAPQANDETLDYPSTDAQMVIPIADLLANDQGNGLLFHGLVTRPSFEDGILRVIEDNLVFTPAAGFTGVAEFQYQVRDTNGVLAPQPALVTIRSWALQQEETKKFFLILMLQED